jgi:hypothetical protein
VFVDPSEQARLEKIPSLLSAARPIHQPEERNCVVLEALSDDPEGIESERFSTNHHQG